ncbi:hypothetical protein HMI54_013170 [Coelomomyces lativittatus]|nr:hypothetical protein HMI54_013170 [Coelomomyces lativittatus]KAJ1506706.1 hypothetical protein HMI56_000479 [Coelomomyces lativittatus]
MEHATHLDFWEKQLMVDRQVLYHESNEDEDFMQRPIVQTSKLKVELIDYVVAWNIFRGENKSNAIVILLNDTKGIQNLISFLRRKNIWVIHSRSADEFRLIKSWIVSCCF